MAVTAATTAVTEKHPRRRRRLSGSSEAKTRRRRRNRSRRSGDRDPHRVRRGRSLWRHSRGVRNGLPSRRGYRQPPFRLDHCLNERVAKLFPRAVKIVGAAEHTYVLKTVLAAPTKEHDPIKLKVCPLSAARAISPAELTVVRGTIQSALSKHRGDRARAGGQRAYDVELNAPRRCSSRSEVGRARGTAPQKA